jgi:hypothetical protein
VREVAAPAVSGRPEKRVVIEKVVDSWLDKKSPKAVGAVGAPPLSSFKELQPTQGPPAAFVCEDDVRTAIQSKSQIVLGRKTIVTPSARELGEANDVFVTASD